MSLCVELTVLLGKGDSASFCGGSEAGVHRVNLSLMALREREVIVIPTACSRISVLAQLHGSFRNRCILPNQVLRFELRPEFRRNRLIDELQILAQPGQAHGYPE